MKSSTLRSEHDKFMGVRIMNYVSALYQDLIKTGEIEGRPLPPVLPMVVGRLSAVAHSASFGG